MRNEHFSLIQYKDINFILGDLQLIEKDKRSRIKLNKPTFNSQTCLDKSKYLLHVFKYKFMLLKRGKKGSSFSIWTLTVVTHQ